MKPDDDIDQIASNTWITHCTGWPCIACLFKRMPKQWIPGSLFLPPTESLGTRLMNHPLHWVALYSLIFREIYCVPVLTGEVISERLWLKLIECLTTLQAMGNTKGSSWPHWDEIRLLKKSFFCLYDCGCCIWFSWDHTVNEAPWPWDRWLNIPLKAVKEIEMLEEINPPVLVG